MLGPLRVMVGGVVSTSVIYASLVIPVLPLLSIGVYPIKYVPSTPVFRSQFLITVISEGDR